MFQLTKQELVALRSQSATSKFDVGRSLENAELAPKLVALEKRYDAQFKVVFDAIRELMEPPVRRSRRIGFARSGR